MSGKPANKPQLGPPSGARPRITSYDSGHEHSLEHWLELKELVEEEFKAAPKPLAMGKAS
jgi:hypothetical protein